MALASADVYGTVMIRDMPRGIGREMQSSETLGPGPPTRTRQPELMEHKMSVALVPGLNYTTLPSKSTCR